MTPSTEELTRILTGVAGDIVERGTVRGPDAPMMWRRGRWATWAGRAAVALIAAVVTLIVSTGALLVSGLPSTTPATGEAATYPEVVSDLFIQDTKAMSSPIFGLVAETPTGSQPDDTLMIERQGALATLITAAATNGEHPRLSSGGTLALAPDGRRVWTSEGILDIDDGFVTHPLASSPASNRMRGVWSPDSEHVLIDTVDGPAVTNRFADVVLSPVPGGEQVRAAGWRDATTVLGVRPSADGRLDVVTRRLTDPTWQTAARVALDAVNGATWPSRAYAAPDGSRLLLIFLPAGSDPARSVLVDARTGEKFPLVGESSTTTVAWDNCDPVWQAGQPLLANNGLRRPATNQSVMSFSGHRQHGCVSVAGNQLTGAPTPGAAGALKEHAWQLWVAALPYGGVLALVGLVWMVVALRRSRRHGERFLPAVVARLF
jgi:hypothetical protein